MRFSRFLAVVAIIATLAGCKSTPPPPPGYSSHTAELQKKFDAMYAQWKKDCLLAPPAQIDATHAQCKEQQDRMSPVDRALQESILADQAAQSRGR